MTSQRTAARTGLGLEGTDPDDVDVTTNIVSAVAELEGVDPMDLGTRLYEVIDPDALETIISENVGSELTVGFNYAGYRVTVLADDDVTVDVAPR